MHQIGWQEKGDDESFDLYYTNDKGEDYNISEAVRSMNKKIEDCMLRVLDDKAIGSLVQLDPETWLIKGEGFS